MSLSPKSHLLREIIFVKKARFRLRQVHKKRVFVGDSKRKASRYIKQGSRLEQNFLLISESLKLRMNYY